ncbi:MAG: hypothetical protein ACXW5U_06245 [Thermoanaerobaculia bacterium]
MFRFHVRRVITVLLLASVATTPLNASILWWRQPKQADVASVHVAVQSVAPFEDYLDALQPRFTLTTEKALSDAIAQTRAQDTATFRAMLATLAVRLPEVTDTLSRTNTNNGTESTTEETRTRNEGPGDLADSVAPSALERTLTAAVPADVETTIDPTLKFRAATALLQEVALLNTYVRDAAVRTGTRPYVVRLLVTVMPTNASRGYNAYTTVSFFTKQGKGTENTVFSEYAAQVVDMNPAVEQAVYSAAEACEKKPLEVVPLLVTDNLEASLHSDNIEKVRDISAAVQGVFGNTRVGGGFRSQRADAADTLTQNLNSLMTVARLAENTIQVRLGATFGNREDVMVPRTYNVTALVLFPTIDAKKQYGGVDLDPTVAADIIPCSQAVFSAQTTLRHARTGRPARRPTEVEAEKPFSRAAEVKRAVAKRALEHARKDDYDEFATVITDRTADLWPYAVSLAYGSSLSRGSFQAPPKEVQFFNSNTHGSLIDDGKTTRLQLTGSQNIQQDRISATVRVKTADHKDLYLPSSSVTVGPDGRSATILFPSIHALLKENVDSTYVEVIHNAGLRNWQGASGVIKIWYPSSGNRAPAFRIASLGKPAAPASQPDPGLGNRVDEIPISYFPPEKEEEEPPAPKAKFSVTTATNVILARKGEGTVNVALKHNEKGATFRMFFQVTGGDIVEIRPAASITGVDRFVETDGVYRLSLDNLIVGTPVTIRSFQIDPDNPKKKIEGDKIVLEVRAQ